MRKQSRNGFAETSSEPSWEVGEISFVRLQTVPGITSRLPVSRSGVIRHERRLDLSVSDSPIFAPAESASGRLPEYQPIRLSRLALDRGAMRAKQE